VIANMRASVLLIALLGVGLARAETATTLAVDIALDESAAGKKAGGCARGFPVPAELRKYAASVCIGEFQLYASTQVCDWYPEFIADLGLKYYRVSVAPTCMDTSGRYWCNVLTTIPCSSSPGRYLGVIETNTKPINCKKNYPSPTNNEFTDPAPPRFFQCPGGFKPLSSSISATYLKRWLVDQRRGGSYIPANQYCSAIGFKWTDVPSVKGCIGNNGQGLIVQGEIQWVCEKQARIRTKTVRIIDLGATLVCPWKTSIKMTNWEFNFKKTAAPPV